VSRYDKNRVVLPCLSRITRSTVVLTCVESPLKSDDNQNFSEFCLCSTNFIIVRSLLLERNIERVKIVIILYTLHYTHTFFFHVAGRSPLFSKFESVCYVGVSPYKGVSKTFRTGRLERELQIVQLSATRCSCIAILWVSLMIFAAWSENYK
jgi:hypothetical protein